MQLELHVYFHSDEEAARRLLAIEAQLTALLSEGKKMSDAMNTLLQRVTDMETVENGAITLLGTIKAELDAALASGDTDAITALSERIGNDTAVLAAAVAANTPTAAAAPAA
jgi:hypothetical protein